jgi:hypothetical protein
MSDPDDIVIENWPTPKLGRNPSPMFPLGMPQLEPMPGSNGLWILTEDWQCVIDGWNYYIAKGFITDGASIPAAFWILVGHPFDPDYVCAALLHDFLWRQCKTWSERTFANSLFRKVLASQGTASRWDRFSLTTGVWFGKLGNALAF